MSGRRPTASGAGCRNRGGRSRRYSRASARRTTPVLSRASRATPPARYSMPSRPPCDGKTPSLGPGEPVVLLHRLTGHAGEWDALAPMLAPAHRVIAVDQRGHGAPSATRSTSPLPPTSRTSSPSSTNWPCAARCWPARSLGGRAGEPRRRLVASLRPGRHGPLTGGKRPALVPRGVGPDHLPHPARPGSVRFHPGRGGHRDAPPTPRNPGRQRARHGARRAPGRRRRCTAHCRNSWPSTPET